MTKNLYLEKQKLREQIKDVAFDLKIHALAIIEETADPALLYTYLNYAEGKYVVLLPTAIFKETLDWQTKYPDRKEQIQKWHNDFMQTYSNSYGKK
jgi:hypothetical protein